MRAFLPVLVAAAAALGAGETAQVVRGPWWWHGPDGAPHVALAVSGSPAIPVRAALDEAEIAVAGDLHPLPADGDGAEAVLVLRLPPGSTGRLRVLVAGQPVAATLRPPPAPAAAVRVALAGARAWPGRSTLVALTGPLGGEPDVVLALGPDVPARLGTGGWEQTIPVAIVAPPDPALAASTGGQDARWRHGLRVGMLGLPASPDRARADLALARDLSPWLVYLDVPAGWDPAMGRRQPGDPTTLAVLIAACRRLEVPLALGAGGAGLVSEPLAMAPGGAVTVAPGGVRYVLPVPAADDGLARLERDVALALEAPLAAGLTADLGTLRLVLHRPGEADATELAWRRGDDPGPGYGLPPADPPWDAVAAAESLAAPEARAAIARWSWLPRDRLTTAMPDPALILRLREEGGAQGRALARRLALIASESPELPALLGDPDPLHARDLLLTRIAAVRGADAAGWRVEAATSPDPHVLRALLADVSRDPARELLPVLVERVRRQADGSLPLDPDALDQHRLFAAVFDEVRLSPTPLRPWAVTLVDRADPLARGPIDRFLARHGRVRGLD